MNQPLHSALNAAVATAQLIMSYAYSQHFMRGKTVLQSLSIFFNLRFLAIIALGALGYHLANVIAPLD